MRLSTFYYEDFNPGGAKTRTILGSSSSANIGSEQIFVGQRGGKFIPRQLRLNPVRITKVTGSAPSLELVAGNHPVWGTRKWFGEIGGVLFDLYNKEALGFPGDHGVDIGMSNIVLQRAYGNVDGSSFDGQLFLAELQETIAMLKNPFKALQSFSKNMRRADSVVERLKKGTDLTADLYLQYKFGIIPIINDIQNAYEAWNKKATIGASFLRAGGSLRKIMYSKEYSTTLTGMYGFSTLTYTLSLETRRDVFGKVYYRHYFENELLQLVNKWGFNPIMLPVTLWQRQPLSFVFDWFASVSAWLRCLAPKPNVEILGNCVSEKYIANWRVSINEATVKINNAPITVYRPKDDSFPECYTRKEERLIRNVNLPVPTGIQWGNGIDSLGKLVSSLALTWQRISNSKAFQKDFESLLKITRRT